MSDDYIYIDQETGKRNSGWAEWDERLKKTHPLKTKQLIITDLAGRYDALLLDWQAMIDERRTLLNRIDSLTARVEALEKAK